MKSKIIVEYFNHKYPFENAEAWDKIGLTFGTIEINIKNIVVALDLTKDVFNLVIKNNVKLIILHHPFIFNDDKEEDFKESPYKKKIFNYLIKNNIAVLTLHTNYDKTNKRTASRIASYLKLHPITSSSLYGHLFNKEITKKELIILLYESMGLKIKETNINDNTIYKKWGLLPGVGSPEEIIKLYREGAEFVITSDVKWSTWLTAFHYNIKNVSMLLTFACLTIALMTLFIPGASPPDVKTAIFLIIIFSQIITKYN